MRELRQAHKLESIGLLAGGVAHDFNNLLSGIVAASEILTEISPPGEQQELSETIFATAQNASTLTQKLLNFSRKGKIVSSPVDAHDLLEDTIAILERSLDRRIAIVRELDAARSIVVGDPSQLQNVFLNLGINARDAMPEGGELAIRTSVAELDAEACRRSPFELAPDPTCASRSRTTAAASAKKT